MVPKETQRKADGNNKDDPGLENRIQYWARNTEEDSRWKEDGTEKPSNSTRKLKGKS